MKGFLQNLVRFFGKDILKREEAKTVLMGKINLKISYLRQKSQKNPLRSILFEHGDHLLKSRWLNPSDPCEDMIQREDQK